VFSSTSARANFTPRGENIAPPWRFSSKWRRSYSAPTVVSLRYSGSSSICKRMNSPSGSSRSSSQSAKMRRTLSSSGASVIAERKDSRSAMTSLLEVQHREVAKRHALARLGEDLGERGRTKSLLDRRQGRVEPLVQRAEPHAVGGQAERAFLEGLDPRRRRTRFYAPPSLRRRALHD